MEKETSSSSSPPSSKPLLYQVEIWQSQSYWPIKGWTAPPRSSQPHYASNLIPNGVSENFPENLNPPEGWDWHDKWSVDTSNSFGQPDLDGWYFASNFEKLSEQLRSVSASGVSTKTSMVRKRRWIRHVVCTSEALQQKVIKRIEEIIHRRVHIESIYKDKEHVYKSIKFYEENRSFVFAQSLHLATQGILNTLSVLKELINKLKLMKQFLMERAEMEKEYANNLEAFAKRYWVQTTPTTENELTSPRAATNRLLERQASLQRLIEDSPTPHETSAAATAIPSASDDGVLQCANIFFSGIHRASEVLCTSKAAFATNLLMLMSNDVSELLLEVQTVLKDARTAFIKNSDICRLSEAAISNFVASLQLAFNSVATITMEEITALTEELNTLRGGTAFDPELFEELSKRVQPGEEEEATALIDPSWTTTNTSSTTTANATANTAANTTSTEKLLPILHASPGQHRRRGSKALKKSVQREDMWLSVQRYKVSVRDSQEALCVLISESMDLELQQQILTNRVHNMFVSVIDNYFTEELTLSADTDLIFTKLMKSIEQKIESIGVPNPILQSPFAKLNPALSMLSDSNDSIRLQSKDPTIGSKDSPDGAQLTRSGSKDYEDDFINSVGIFSFTTLFKEPLPANPGVIKSGYLFTIRPSELLPPSSSSRSNSPSSFIPPIDSTVTFSPPVWRQTYVVATSDGYLHIIYGRKSEIPDRSFYMKTSYLNDSLLVIKDEELRERMFEIFMMTTTGSIEKSKRSGNVHKAAARILEGLYLQTENKAVKEDWIYTLKHLTQLPIHVDEIIEQEAKESMLQSLPILKGETAKIDLEMKNYEKYQQENPPTTTLATASRIHSMSMEERKSVVEFMGSTDTNHSYQTNQSGSIIIDPSSNRKGEEERVLLLSGIAGSISFNAESREDLVGVTLGQPSGHNTVWREDAEKSTDAQFGSADSQGEWDQVLEEEEEVIDQKLSIEVTTTDEVVVAVTVTEADQAMTTNLPEEAGEQTKEIVSSPIFKMLSPHSSESSTSPLMQQRLSFQEKGDEMIIPVLQPIPSTDSVLSPMSQSHSQSSEDSEENFFRYSKSYHHLPLNARRGQLETVHSEDEEENDENPNNKEEPVITTTIITSDIVIEEHSEIDHPSHSHTTTAIPAELKPAPVVVVTDTLLEETTAVTTTTKPPKATPTATNTTTSNNNNNNSEEVDFFNTNPNLRYETDSDDDSVVSSSRNNHSNNHSNNTSRYRNHREGMTTPPTATTPSRTPTSGSNSNNRRGSVSSQSQQSKSAYGGFDYSATSNESWLKYDQKKSSTDGISSSNPNHNNSTTNNALKRPISVASMLSASHNKPSPSSFVGMVPVAEIKPKQIIPQHDSSMPLARRHSQMIKQYEQGLQFERQKASLRVKESKREHLSEVIDLVIDPTLLNNNTNNTNNTEESGRGRSNSRTSSNDANLTTVSLSNREVAASLLRGDSPQLNNHPNDHSENHSSITIVSNVGYNSIPAGGGTRSRASSFASQTDHQPLQTQSLESHDQPSSTYSGSAFNSYDDVDQLLPNLVTGKKIVKKLTEKFDSAHHHQQQQQQQQTGSNNSNNTSIRNIFEAMKENK